MLPIGRSAAIGRTDANLKKPQSLRRRDSALPLSPCRGLCGTARLFAIRRAFQPPVALPGADLPPARDFFLEGQIQQFLKSFALPVFDVGAPGACVRFSPRVMSCPVALPSLAFFFRPPRSFNHNLSGRRKRPGALRHIGMLGKSAACPRSVKALPLAGGDDPGAVNGLGRLLRKGADKE